MTTGQYFGIIQMITLEIFLVVYILQKPTSKSLYSFEKFINLVSIINLNTGDLLKSLFESAHYKPARLTWTFREYF